MNELYIVYCAAPVADAMSKTFKIYDEPQEFAYLLWLRFVDIIALGNLL